MSSSVSKRRQSEVDALLEDAGSSRNLGKRLHRPSEKQIEIERNVKKQATQWQAFQAKAMCRRHQAIEEANGFQDYGELSPESEEDENYDLPGNEMFTVQRIEPKSGPKHRKSHNHPSKENDPPKRHKLSATGTAADPRGPQGLNLVPCRSHIPPPSSPLGNSHANTSHSLAHVNNSEIWRRQRPTTTQSSRQQPLFGDELSDYGESYVSYDMDHQNDPTDKKDPGVTTDEERDNEPRPMHHRHHNRVESSPSPPCSPGLSLPPPPSHSPSPILAINHHNRMRDNVTHTANHIQAPDSIQARTASSEKRKRTPPTRPASPSGLRVVKARKLGSGGSRGRPRGKDWDVLTWQVLNDAWGHFRARVSTEYPYPGQEEEVDWAGEAWVKACRAKNIDMELEDELVKTIIQCGSQIRGKLKEQAVLLVPQAYGLHATASDNDIRENRDKITRLKVGEKPAFIFQNPDTRYRMYEHEIIQTLVNATWFRKKTDTGVRYSEYFKGGIPIVTIALVLTAVENVLDEWATGVYVQKDFSERAYKETFEKHWALLENFRKQTQELHVLKHIRLNLLGNAREHAGVSQHDRGASVPQFNEEEIQAVLDDWRDRVGDHAEGVDSADESGDDA